MQEIVSDPNAICVIGSGPVGLSFALRLADADQPVVLIDSGDLVGDAQQEFLGGTMANAARASDCQDTTLLPSGTLYARHSYMTRSRYLGSGGASQLWCVKWRPEAESRVRIVRSAAADFEARPDFDIPSWQVPGDDITRHYDAAMAFFDLGGHDFEAARYGAEQSPLGLSQELFPTKLFHFPLAISVFQNRMAEARQHDGISVLSNLHFLRFETKAHDWVRSIIVADRDGQEQRLVAHHFVLALGGIENSRQLLLAVEDGALLDEHGVFGRWFFDHPHTRLGYLNSADPGALTDQASWYDFQEYDGTPIMRGHEIAPDIARTEGLLRFSIDLVARPPNDDTIAGAAVADMWDRFRGRNYLGGLSYLPKLAAHPLMAYRIARTALNTRVHNTGHGGWSDPAQRNHDVGSLAVEAMFEQRPSPDNRIRLGYKRDPFGRRMPVLQWSWSAKEAEAINRAAEFVGAEFTRAGAGQFVPMRDLRRGAVPRAGSGFHHMGGTRQSTDATSGVVNGNNRMHGVENLTLIGSSIFPNTTGYANPTLTAVADALRTADHLRQSA
ncbi:MAG: GMC oxidoreductase [Pseudomonadota bacterium]